MPNIFDYLDYRRFLYDYYTERKLREPSFSYRIFAEQAGFHSKSFIKHVMEGTKNLTDDSVLKLNRALNLKKKAFSYFNELVHFNHSSTSEEKNLHLSRLHSFNKRNKARLISKSQYEFYSNWYHNTIRELVCLHDFKDDNAKLAADGKPRHYPTASRAIRGASSQAWTYRKKGRQIHPDRFCHIHRRRGKITGDQKLPCAEPGGFKTSTGKLQPQEKGDFKPYPWTIRRELC